ncbi:Organic anion transporter polypeptide OATP [Trinorchestia longiramus]|nr:Organic anion transporter polypeptide OATP [Trinorchestia longiramus]
MDPTAVLSSSNAMLDALPPSPADGADDDEVQGRTKKEIQEILYEMDIDDIKCGVGPCKPNFLQKLAKKEIYLVLYSFVGVFMGMFFTYTVSIISTLEKRFDMSSKTTGFILAGNDVSQVLLSVVITYYGNYGNRPQWMGLGVISSAVSCFIAASPHLIYGSGSEAASTTFATSANNTVPDGTYLCPYTGEEVCDVNDEGNRQTYMGPAIILFLSQFFLGITVSSYYSIGLIYLDDNVKKTETSLYYGISLVVRVLGPVMGFFLGSQCLSYWIDPSQSPDISQRDPRWMGAWWLGFLILGILLAISGFFLMFFPKQLSSSLAAQIQRLETAEIKKNPQKNENLPLEYYLTLTKQKKKHTKPSLKKLPAAIKRLFTNKVYMGNCFDTVCAILALSGYWSFKPKYLETQFHRSASEANFYTGVASLIASMLGIILGGLVMKWKQPKARYVAAYSIFICLVSASIMFSLAFVKCPTVEILGIDAECSADCDCNNKFQPVCSAEKENYYSACLAGCVGSTKNGTDVVYQNCKCLVQDQVTLQTFDPSVPPSSLVYNNAGVAASASEAWATDGYCASECSSLFTYIGLTIISKLIGASGRVGGTLVFLRSLNEEDRALALGIMTVFFSMFAFIPGPIIMGAIVDSACLVWDTKCGEQGNCWLYDADKFRLLMHLVTGSLMLLSIVGDIVVFIYSKDLELYKDPEEIVEMNATKEKANQNLVIHNNDKPK